MAVVGHELKRAVAATARAAIRDPFAALAPLRLLVLCDRPSASQEVHLFRALRRLRAGRDCGLVVHSEETAAAAAAADPDWCARELREFNPHAMIVSRFGDPSVHGALRAARERDVPVIAQLDDFLLEVPAELGPEKIRQHMRPERIQALRAQLAQADLLYISTESLAQRLRDEGFRGPILVSELQSCVDADEIAAPPMVVADDVRPVRIGYQGTRNHVHDLAMIVPGLVKTLRARPDVTFTLFGTIQPTPELREAVGGRLEIVPAAAGGYGEFLRALAGQRWDIGLAPLRDIPFNSYRTYTKWTEYSAAGICTVASAGNVYEPVIAHGEGGADAGVLVREADWSGVLIDLIDKAWRRREHVDAAQRLLRERYTLAGQEAQVLAMLRRVAAV
jgi:hypothetical protein